MCVSFFFCYGIAMLRYVRVFCQGLNTTTTLVLILQNVRFTFSFKENTYLGLVQFGSGGVGLVAYWYIQRHWKIDTKKMERLLSIIFLNKNLVVDMGFQFIATNIVAVMLPLWGMIGIWTDKFG